MRRWASVVAVLVVGSAGCTDTGPVQRAATPVLGRVVGAVLEGRLNAFDSCAGLMDDVRAQAAALVGPYGLPTDHGWGAGMPMPAMAMADADATGAGAGAPAAARSSMAAQEAGGFSTTNVQEAGVDEPDVVKTDGRLVVAVVGNRLHVADVTGDEPVRRGTLDLGAAGGAQLLLSGTRVLVLSTASSSDFAAVDPPMQRSTAAMSQGGVTTATVVDVADPDRPAVVSTLTFDGRYVSARLVDGVARLVLHSDPKLPWQPPGPVAMESDVLDDPAAYAAAYRAAEERAAAANRDVVARSALDDWLPHYRVEAPAGGSTVSGRLVSCEAVSRPSEPSGVGMLTVVSVDPADPKPGEAVSVMAAGEVVYASGESLFVATQRWPVALPAAEAAASPPAPTPVTTQVHRFDIADPARARYVGSGEVPGSLLDQFSMDEHDGFLRVATTEEPLGPVGPDGQPPVSESAVTVLATRDGALVPVGRVGGLGRGERIFSVRFLDDVGYVVTFRQTDPLYVVDLRDPERPAVTGELKVPGFSSYLHPLGDGLLLGVGQDATDQGRATGSQVSLFDVSDPARPSRLAQASFGAGRSPVEDDHRAFLWWAPEGLAVVPLELWNEDTGGSRFVGAVGLRVDRAQGLSEVGRVVHDDQRASAGSPDFVPTDVRRALVVGDTLYTLSDRGLMASALDDLSPRSFLAW